MPAYPRLEQREYDLVLLDPPALAKSAFGTVDLLRDYQSLLKPGADQQYPPARPGARSLALRFCQRQQTVSAVVPVEPGIYHAAIAVKALYEGGAPRFHTLLTDQVFKTATAADATAAQQLEHLKDVTEDGELVW